jgi:hypothetical protein
MFVRLVQTPLENLRLFYLSHPITAIRSKGGQLLPSFVGELNGLIREFLEDERNILFYPTAIDELNIMKKGDKFYPDLSGRWECPYDDEKLLFKELRDDLGAINPFNPNKYDIDNDSSALENIASLLDLLWQYIYKKHTISRDYTLVEQSYDGVIVCRPRYKGESPGGVRAELEFCCALLDKQPRRKCIVLSCKEDRNKSSINLLFSRLEENLKPPLPENFGNVKKEWLTSNHNVLDTSADDIRAELIRDVLAESYDFYDPTKGSHVWEGDELGRKGKRKRRRLDEIIHEMGEDTVTQTISEHVETAEAKARIFYDRDITEDKFWKQAPVSIKDWIAKQEEV